MDSLSSSSNTSALEQITLNELVTRRHANILSLPEELSPASRPCSPIEEERVLAIRACIATAVNTAGGDTTNPKWGYVSRMTQIGSTSRRYISVAPGIRMGEGKKVSLGRSFEWGVPEAEAEAEWQAYEQRWEEAVVAEEERRKDKATMKALKTSKHFKPAVVEEPEVTPAASIPSSKAEVIREKVQRWQAQVVTVALAPDEPMSQSMVSDTAPSQVVEAKGKERAHGVKVQASLGFPVMKRASVNSGKGGSSASSKPRVSPAAGAPTPPSDVAAASPSEKAQEPRPASDLERVPEIPESAVVAHIAEVPECSFLPPSFPSQLQTSTPPLNDRRHKPHPIAPCSPPPSSPQSIRSFDPSHPKRCAPQQASSEPAVSPIRKRTKRARTPNSPSEDVRMDISEAHSPSTRSPFAKKARVESSHPQGPEQEPISSGPAPVPPSTPPPSSPAAPVTPVSRTRILGNAKGLPVPTTPNPLPLPTLTDLLASSRRSRPRPRPPSRKNTPHSKAGSVGHDKFSEVDSELPAVPEAHERHSSSREHTPEPSPAKTYFSSPASGSSDSPGSIRGRLSPVSPLYTQNPGAFAPRYVSTQLQQGNGVEDVPFTFGGQSQSQSQGSLMRGGSGFFAMGYSSQFDVEGHVEQVSELLDKDVDFNGWLRDLGPEAEEDRDQDQEMATPSQSQDAGAVSVGGLS